MKTFMDLRLDVLARFCECDLFTLECFAKWLDQRYAPAPLPTGAKPGVSADASAATENAAIAPTVPAADNSGDVFSLNLFSEGVTLHFTYEQIQNDKTLAVALSTFMFSLSFP